MKKLQLSILVIICAFNFSYAQNTFPTSGNAGLNTTSPPTIGNYGVMALNGSSPSQGGYLSMMTNGSEVGSIVSNSQFNFQTTSGFTTQFYTGSNPTLQISAAGNIGIGTTSPASKLAVAGGDFQVENGQGRFKGWYSAGTGRALEVGISGSIGYIYNYDRTALTEGDLTIGGVTAGGMTVKAATGNVLIGQTTQVNSAYKLDVAGYVRATKIVVNSTGADFVFAPTYKLPTLPEIEKYIKQNHHLSEIPSANEMQKEGMDLGQLNTKLLQKVEEFTLYLIEKDKENKDLKQAVKAQQKEIDELKANRKEMDSLKKQVELLTKTLNKK